MKVPLKWLKEYVDISLSPTELAERLTMAGLEVSEIIYAGSEIENVVVGEIISLKPIPQSDRLSLCQVSDGKQIFPVVCGATNIKAKDLVPLARVGATLPGGRKIGKAKIRGFASHGMLCSAKELGIGEDASGIYILRPGCKLGEDIKKVLELQDAVLEVELTTNRSDCASIFGMAREVSAILGASLKPVRIEFNEQGTPVSELARVEVLDPDACKRYTARVIRDVQIGPSPSWLARRLQLAGVRPINNVVDITNYVLIELGHPLHAFDYDKLAEHKIVVRFANPDEKLVTLDEEERKLSSGNLIIADAHRPVALAGVMGGKETSVQDSTRNVLLESAYFSSQAVRRTARFFGMETESSYRFERGVDIENVITASNRACQLMEKLAGGKVSPGIIDFYPKPLVPVEIQFSPSAANRVLGVEISTGKMAEFLCRLGFEVSEKGGDFLVKVPSYRNDISRDIDLVEEIARLYGYDNIPVQMPRIRMTDLNDDEVLGLEDTVRDILTRLGLCEVITRSLVSSEYLSELKKEISEKEVGIVDITNPMTRELGSLRDSLVPGLLSVLRRNLSYGIGNVKIFEVGRVFLPAEPIPVEKRLVAGLVTGMAEEDHWREDSRVIDFYYAKGIVDSFLRELGISRTLPQTGQISEGGHPLLRKDIAQRIVIDNEYVGEVAEVDSEVCRRLEARTKVYVFEIDFDKLCKLVRVTRKYEKVSRFPTVSRDISLIVPEGLTFAEIYGKIKSVGGQLVREVRLFDVYFGEQVGKGNKGLNCRVIYQSQERTLTDEGVNTVQERIVEALEKDLKIRVRR